MNHIKKTPGEWLFDGLNYIFLGLLTLMFIVPFWHVFMYSLSDIVANPTSGLFLWPRGLDLTVYKTLLTSGSSLVMSGFRISLCVTLVGTLIGTFLSALLAYPISKPFLKGRALVTFLVVFTMMFSGGFVQYYLLIRNLGLYDSYAALVLPMMLDGFNVIIMRNFFAQIPESLEESAKVDGADYFTIFFKITIPLSKTVLATVALFIAIRYWNDYFSSMMYVSSSDKWSLAQVLRDMLSASLGSKTGSMLNIAKGKVNMGKLRNATIVLTIVPMLLVYPFAQRFFIKGIVMGSVKG